MFDLPKVRCVRYNIEINFFFFFFLLVNKNNSFQYFGGRHRGIVLLRLKQSS